jgi:hypothetical protein
MCPILILVIEFCSFAAVVSIAQYIPLAAGVKEKKKPSKATEETVGAERKVFDGSVASIPYKVPSVPVPEEVVSTTYNANL